MESDDLNHDQISNEDMDSEPTFIDTSSMIEVHLENDIEPIDDAVSVEDDILPDIMDTEGSSVLDMAKKTFSCHNDSVYAVVMDYSMGCVVSGGGDDKAYMSSVSGESVLLDQNHTDTVSCIKFNWKKSDSVNKKLLAVGSYDGTTILYDENGMKLSVLEGPSDVEWIDWHPKGGTVILVGSTDGTIWMYYVADPCSPKVLQVFVGHQNDVTSGQFSPNGKYIITCGVDHTVKIWAPKTGLCKHTFDDNFASAPITCFTVKNELGLCGCEDGSLWILGLGPGSRRILDSFSHCDKKENSVEAVAFYHGTDYNWCATGGSDGFLKVWDLAGNSAHCRQTCNHDGAVITRLCWHPVHPFIFTAASDGNVRIWNARSGICILTLTGHTSTINDMDIEFSDTHILIVTGSDDSTVKIFEVDALTTLHESNQQ